MAESCGAQHSVAGAQPDLAVRDGSACSAREALGAAHALAVLWTQPQTSAVSKDQRAGMGREYATPTREGRWERWVDAKRSAHQMEVRGPSRAGHRWRLTWAPSGLATHQADRLCPRGARRYGHQNARDAHPGVVARIRARGSRTGSGWAGRACSRVRVESCARWDCLRQPQASWRAPRAMRRTAAPGHWP